MISIKTTALSFTFLAAAVMLGDHARAESSKPAEPPAEVEQPVGVAAAASSCPGTRIEHIATPSSSAPEAFLDIFFDSSTGDNCAMMVGAGSAAGHASSIEVCLIRCKETSPGPTCTVDAEQCDSGAFHSFAGPVSIHAPGKCISAFGDLTFNGTTFFAELLGASHCG